MGTSSNGKEIDLIKSDQAMKDRTKSEYIGVLKSLKDQISV